MTTTDSEGRFTISGHSESVVVAARNRNGSGLVVEATSDLEATRAPDGDIELLLQLSEPRQLELAPSPDAVDPDLWRVALWAAMPEDVPQKVPADQLAPLIVDPPLRVAGDRRVIEGLSPARYALRIKAPGRATFNRTIDLTEESAEIAVSFTLAIARTIRVVDSDSGLPVAGARVRGNVKTDDSESAHLSDAITDREGYARLEHLPEGSANLAITHPGYSPWAGSMEPSEEHVARLSRGGTLIAQLKVGSATPSHPTVVSLSEGSDQGAELVALTDADGSARFTRLRPGTWNLRVSNQVISATGGPVSVHDLPTAYTNFPTHSIEIHEGETTTVVLDPLALAAESNPSGGLMGHVLLDGAPAAGCRMTLSRVMLFANHTIELPADGSFHFPSLPVGETTIGIDPPGWSRSEASEWTHFATKRVDIKEGETESLRLDLQSASLRGQVRWAEDATAVANATITATRTIHLSSNATTWSKEVTRTDREGRFSFEPALCGQWQLTATADGAKETETTKFEVVPRSTVDVPTITLERGIPLRGRVVLPTGSITTETIELRFKAGSETVKAEALAPDFSFDLAVHVAGRHHVTLNAWPLDLSPTTIDVPETGLTDAILRPETDLPEFEAIVSGKIALPYEGAPKVVMIGYREGSTGYGSSISDDSFGLSMSPGTYTFTFRDLKGDQPYEPIQIEVPTEGLSDLTLRLILKP